MCLRESFCSKHIYVLTININRWSASSIRLIFTRRADLDHRKVSDIPNRNSKTKSFQNGRAEFRDTINLSKVQCIKVIPPFSKMCNFYCSKARAYLAVIDLKEAESWKLLLNAFQFAGICGRNRIPNTQAHSTLDLTNVKYNMNICSRDENLKVMLQNRPYNFRETIKLTWLWK
jgi:hypothetical protein